MPKLIVDEFEVEVSEVSEDCLIRFKLDNVWRDPDDYIIPHVTALDFILRIHRLWPWWSRELKDFASNSEVKRWLENSAVRFNGRALKPKDVLDFPLYSVILFPKGQRVTLI